MPRCRFLSIAACVLAVMVCLRAVADETKNPEAKGKPGEAARKAEPKASFLRLTRDAQDEPLAMQTAIVRYVPKDQSGKDGGRKGLVVDLIGAVHIGEKSYYEALNKEFEKYDVLLYELVAPAGTRVPKGGGDGGNLSAIHMLQDGMKNMLHLEHQLQYVDYQKKNFVHADMSPDDFSKSMAERGESFMTMFFRMMGQAMARQNQNPQRTNDLDILMALFDPNRAIVLKRLMAEQFEDLEGAMDALDGPGGSTILTERNKVALKGLAQQIKKGQKKIGIFYGAGHMPDMEQRLMKEFGLKRAGERWLTAWDLRDMPKAKPASSGKAPASKPFQSKAKASPDKVPAGT
jgi:hypothetical protein